LGGKYLVVAFLFKSISCGKLESPVFAVAKISPSPVIFALIKGTP